MPKHKSFDYKIQAVKYYLKNKNQVKTCEIFECSERSLMRWVKKYNEIKTIKRKDKTYISYKITKEQVKFILELVKKNRTITLKEIKEKLKEKFNDLDISIFHLHRILKDQRITLKLSRFRHEPEKRFGKEININQKLKEFYDEIKKHKLDDIICIDESSISSLQKRKYCYSPIGKRCIIKTHSQEVFKKYTSIFAISTKGIIGWKLYDKGGIDTERLYDFLEEHITSKMKNKLIILDNASSHRNQRIKDLINKNNILLYSIPYQHFTNADEQFFSILKNRLQKKEGLTYNELKINIEKSIKEIKPDIYKNIFKGSYERDKNYKMKTKKVSKKLKIYKD